MDLLCGNAHLLPENPEFSSIEGFPGYYSGKIELDIVRKL